MALQLLLPHAELRQTPILLGAPGLATHARVEVPAPAAHALLIRAPVHVPRDVRPAQAVRLHQRGELRGVGRGPVLFFEVSCLGSV